MESSSDDTRDLDQQLLVQVQTIETRDDQGLNAVRDGHILPTADLCKVQGGTVRAGMQDQAIPFKDKA